MLLSDDIFPFVIASKWPDGSLCPYAFGSEVKHGNLKQAKDFLKYVKKQSEDKNYKIYKLTELKEKNYE